MPNWIATTLRIKGETAALEAVKKFVASDLRAFDFDKIIPMPETFKKYDTTNYPNGERLQLGEHVGYRKDSPIVTPELIDEYKAATRQQAAQYGAVGWYDWSCSYWGTKWNASDSALAASTDGDELVYTFDTAWSFAQPVVKALSEIFPEVVIEFVYADEDAGYNTGRGIAQGGEFTEFVQPDGGSDEAMQLYFETHPGSEDEYVRDENGNWRYYEG